MPATVPRNARLHLRLASTLRPVSHGYVRLSIAKTYYSVNFESTRKDDESFLTIVTFFFWRLAAMRSNCYADSQVNKEKKQGKIG